MDNFEAIKKIQKRSNSKEEIKLISEDKSFLIKKTWKDVNTSNKWKKDNLDKIQNRMKGWQLETFKESYKNKSN